MKRKIAVLLFATLLLASGAALANITLTNSVPQASILGGTATIAYDTVQITSVTMDTLSNTVTANVRLVSSGTPSAPALLGQYTVVPGSLVASMEVGTLRFQQSKSLSGAQASAVAAAVLAVKNDIEQTMITFGLVAGTRN